MNYAFSNKDIIRFSPHHTPEWTMTLGNGGFVSGAVDGTLFRHHHGYLVASLLPPTNRYSILSKTIETIDNEPMISHHQKAFLYDGLVTSEYAYNGVSYKKIIVPYYNHNAVGIRYEFTSCKSRHIAISPLFNIRPNSDVSSPTKPSYIIDREGNQLRFYDAKHPTVKVHVSWSMGTLVSKNEIIGPIQHWFDASTGDPRLDYGFIPFEFDVALLEGTFNSFELIVSANENLDITVNDMIQIERNRQAELIKKSGYVDPLAQQFVIAADQFIVKRQSTHATTILAGLPWFADWGRDTMIAYLGLVLQTKRFDEARQILHSFVQYESNGIIPNMFPDAPNPPLYNTVDASLWFFQAIYAYYEATHDSTFIKDNLFRTMKRIIKAYQEGTSFSIHMDTDGLIHAGSGLDQVTWMDVRINNIVVTPRHGKPVEINALWYNALMIMDYFTNLFDEPNLAYLELSKRVNYSFNQKFWNSKRNCLYDVIDAYDESIRPNQVYATSLSFPIVGKTRGKKLLQVVKKELLDIYGLRTLSIHDPRFIPIYDGPIEKRDFAYHMGTTWPFLLGGYCEGYLKMHSFSPQAFGHVKKIILRFKTHLQEGSLNGIAEIFDGDQGTISRGCHTQAWSVGEIMRIYTQYLLQEDTYAHR